MEVVGGQELLVQVPLPMAEVWAEMQPKVEELAGQARLQILRAILENEVTQRVGLPNRPNPSVGCVRLGQDRVLVVSPTLVFRRKTPILYLISRESSYQ
jgi:hypothetical protein